jgi:hypothetical protein
MVLRRKGPRLPRLGARPCVVRSVPVNRAARRAAPAGSLKENYVKYYLTPTSLFMEAKHNSLNLCLTAVF